MEGKTKNRDEKQVSKRSKNVMESEIDRLLNLVGGKECAIECKKEDRVPQKEKTWSEYRETKFKQKAGVYYRDQKGKIQNSSRMRPKENRRITRSMFWAQGDEFLDVIYWSRQALGIIIGLLWGLIPLKGFVALLL
ncbi:unnamed protein product, partial [Timema podura]|nr:unnamed protein product [Timema podura]